MRFRHNGHEARRVNARDYDGMRELVTWCGGRAIDDNEYVIALPTPVGEATVRHDDWVIRDMTGTFHVYRCPEWRPIVDPWPWFLAHADQ